MRRRFLFVALVCVGVLAAAATALAASSIWPQMMGGPAHNGYSSSIGPTRIAEKWPKVLVGENDAAATIVGADAVYAYSTSGLTAIDIATGAVKWRVGNTEMGFFNCSNPAIGPDGTVYASVQTPDIVNRIAAFDPVTGAYRFLCEGRAGGSYLTVNPNGDLYCYDSQGLAAVKPDGTARWHQPAVIQGNVAVSPDGSAVYACVGNSAVVKLSAATGAVMWKMTTPILNSFWGGLSVSRDGSRVYVPNQTDLRALNARTGKTAWIFVPPGDLGVEEAVAAEGADGFVRVLQPDRTSSGHLYCLSATKGTQKWVFNANPGDCWTQGAVTVDGAGKTYFGGWSYAGAAYCVDARGSLVWQYPVNDAYWSAPAIAPDGTLYWYMGSDHTDGTGWGWVHAFKK